MRASLRISPRRVAGVFLLTALTGGIAVAGEPSLTVRLEPRRLGVRDVARLEIRIVGGEVEGNIPSPSGLKNLQVVGGPSTAQQFSWVNGVSSSSVTYTYVLQPLAEGPAEVGPIRVKVAGRELQSGAVSATVVAGSVVRARQRPRLPASPFEQLFTGGGRRRVRIGLRLVVPKLKLYEGEPMPVTVVLETTAGVDGFEWTRPPTFPGWWASRVKLPDQVNPSLIQRGGIRYRQYPVARYVLVPLKAGTLKIPAMGARIGIRSFSVFNPTQVVERRTPETKVRVLARPPAPQGYSGAVGALKYRASISAKPVRLGDSAVLRIELAGNGNLPLVEAPAVWPACATCDSYPPEESSKVVVDSRGIHGRRVWAKALVPRQWGKLRLPEIRLAVFNPKTGAYSSQTLGPFSVEVTPPPATPTPTPEIRRSEAVTATARGPAPSPGAPAGESSTGFRWAWLAGALGIGILVGLGAAVVLVRSRRIKVPAPVPGQSPVERARQLQGALEGWWASLAERKRTDARCAEVDALRRELEGVRFAPGRADHSQTVVELETRLRSLMKRA